MTSILRMSKHILRFICGEYGRYSPHGMGGTVQVRSNTNPDHRDSCRLLVMRLSSSVKVDSRLRGNDEEVSALRHRCQSSMYRCQRKFLSLQRNYLRHQVSCDTESVAHWDHQVLRPWEVSVGRPSGRHVALKGAPQNKIARDAGSCGFAKVVIAKERSDCGNLVCDGLFCR